MQFWILRVRFQVVEMLFSSMYFKRGSHVFLVYTIKVFFLTVAIGNESESMGNVCTLTVTFHDELYHKTFDIFNQKLLIGS